MPRAPLATNGHRSDNPATAQEDVPLDAEGRSLPVLELPPLLSSTRDGKFLEIVLGGDLKLPQMWDCPRDELKAKCVPFAEFLGFICRPHFQLAQSDWSHFHVSVERLETSTKPPAAQLHSPAALQVHSVMAQRRQVATVRGDRFGRMIQLGHLSCHVMPRPMATLDGTFRGKRI